MSVFYNMQTPPPPSNLADYIGAANGISNNIAQSIAGTSAQSQQDAIYDMVRLKNVRVRNLAENLSKNFSGQVYLTDHIFHAVTYKPKGANMHFFNMNSAPKIFENSVVILSNNNVMTDNNLNRFIELYLNSPTSAFVIWDFDNHHWFALSGMLAASCDLYVPTHSDNLEPLSRFNNIMAGPVGSGTIQWSKEYLRQHLNLITDTDRSNDPLGTHIEYPQFTLRQKNLTILNKTLPNVKLVDGSYHGRDMLDRFTEWCSHKAHWIVPVQKYHRDVVNMHDHILFYDYEDIQNPSPITEKANKIFDDAGKDGILARHNLIMNNYHVDNRVEDILKAVQNEFRIPNLV